MGSIGGELLEAVLARAGRAIQRGKRGYYPTEGVDDLPVNRGRAANGMKDRRTVLTPIPFASMSVARSSLAGL